MLHIVNIEEINKLSKPERKENKKHDAWNRKHYGKKLAKMYRKLRKLEYKLAEEMRPFYNGGPLPSKYTLDKYDAYKHKCFQACFDKYFWRGDAYYM